MGEVNSVRKEGDRNRLYTDQPGEVACLLVEYAKTEHLKVLSLNTYGPRLEDIFVHLTYTCELARHALLGDGYYPILLGLLLLLVFTVIFFFASIQIHKRSMPKRLS